MRRYCALPLIVVGVMAGCSCSGSPPEPSGTVPSGDGQVDEQALSINDAKVWIAGAGASGAATVAMGRDFAVQGSFRVPSSSRAKIVTVVITTPGERRPVVVNADNVQPEQSPDGTVTFVKTLAAPTKAGDYSVEIRTDKQIIATLPLSVR